MGLVSTDDTGVTGIAEEWFSPFVHTAQVKLPSALILSMFAYDLAAGMIIDDESIVWPLGQNLCHGSHGVRIRSLMCGVYFSNLSTSVSGRGLRAKQLGVVGPVDRTGLQNIFI